MSRIRVGRGNGGGGRSKTLVLAPVHNPSPYLRAAREMIAAEQQGLVITQGLGAVPGGGGLPGRSESIPWTTGDQSGTINVVQVAEGFVASAETVIEFMRDPCAALGGLAQRGVDYLSAEVQEAITATVTEAVGAIQLPDYGGLDIAAIRECADRAKGGSDTGSSCTGMARTVGETVGRVAGQVASSDYVGLVAKIIKTIVGTLITMLIKFLLDKLAEALVGALLGALRAMGCREGDETFPDGSEVPPLPSGNGGSGLPPPPPPQVTPEPEPPVQQTQPLPGGEPPPKPPPPPFMAAKKTDWLTYLLWGGMGLGVALAASKTLTGAWVPPQVARRVAPVTAKVKRLRR